MGTAVGIYKILTTRFSHEEAMAILEYMETLKSPCAANQIMKVTTDMQMKFIKVDHRIKMTFILAVGISILIARILWVALTK